MLITAIAPSEGVNGNLLGGSDVAIVTSTLVIAALLTRCGNASPMV
jgi:hypothetical protein